MIKKREYMRKFWFSLVFVTLVVTLFSSCTILGDVQFINVDTTGDLKQEIVRGKPYQMASVDDGIEIMLTAQPTYDGDEVQVTVGIANTSESDFFFQDAAFELFRGNVETGEWESLGKWNASEYYSDKYRQAKTEEAWATVAGVFAVLDAALGNTSYTTVRGSGGTTTSVTTHTYSPAATALTGFAAVSYVDSLASRNQFSLQELDSSLLYSSIIKAKSDYAGNIFIEADRKSPEYRLTYISRTGEKTDFVFSRSDRDRITKP